MTSQPICITQNKTKNNMYVFSTTITINQSR